MFDYFWFFITDRNPEQRAKKYELLGQARKGDITAMGNLAKLCKDSNDTSTALKWYLKIVKSGGTNAIKATNNIGNIYYLKRNYQKALNYYESAANQGLVIAKRNIGKVYEDLEQYTNAISWYRAASSSGDVTAKLRLENLLRRPTNRAIDDWQEAEELARRWMFYFGFTDAVLTKGGADGGIDVTSASAVAQVKYRTSKTGSPDIGKLEYVAGKEGKQSIFFSLSGYSKQALEWADESTNKMALFTYDKQGNVEANNRHARILMEMAKNQ